MNKSLTLIALILTVLGAGCASGPESPAYPAFVIADELPDLFLASLPGVRAKEFSGDMRSRSMSDRIELPADWSGTTGGSPGKALEIYVLAGELSLADISLTKGGYAYVPPGSLGFNMQTDEGALILYFLGDFDSAAFIRTPLILDSDLVEWRATDEIGIFTKDLRVDPGSGERTWLQRVEPGAQIPWQASSAALEGYLISGQFQDSECVAGESYTDIYSPGGYFRRPSEAVHGGPEANAISESIWYLREGRESATDFNVTCGAE